MVSSLRHLVSSSTGKLGNISVCYSITAHFTHSLIELCIPGFGWYVGMANVALHRITGQNERLINSNHKLIQELHAYATLVKT